ncbi:T9SS type A sorting domain-containing protein [Aquimarina sp. 2201CG1-2-11]|uniref:VPS10 domain-containing protein n=1 Tax=Aquimarina discodermiae TaxID=3231043 RepID=UPI0034622BD3
MKTILQFFVLFLCVNIYAQNSKNPRDIKDILSNPFYEQNESSKNGYSQKNAKRLTFQQIVEEADAYFKNKYPDLNPKDLSRREFKDDNDTKYQRWKSFWKKHLNSDGTLADYTKPAVLKAKAAKNKGTSARATCADSEYTVNWSEVNYNGNFGYQIDMGRVSSIAFHPTDVNTFYVGAAFGGLWKTTDGGQSYTNINDDLPHTAVADIIIDTANSNRIFIALSDITWYGPNGIGIYESTDGGVTFSPTNLTFDLIDGIRIYEMDVNPNDASEFLVATSDGLYRTTDYFSTTTKIINQPTTAVKYNLNSNDAHAGGSQGEYYLSTNNGQTFTLDEDFGNGQVRISVSNKANSGYVAITSSNNLNVSTDYGRNFIRKSLPEQNSVIMFANGSDTDLMVGNFECYRSTNTGDSFQATSQWLGQSGLPFIHVDQRNIYRNPLENDYVYYCNDGGVFKYSVSGNNFTNLSSDLFITQYYDIAVSQTDANVLGGGSQDNGNVTRNSNGQWQSYYPTADGMGQEIDFTDANTRYYAWQNGNVFRWVNGAVTNISPPGKGGRGAWETPYKLDPNNASRIIIGYDNVYASDNKGNTWTNIGNNLAGGSNLEQIAIAKSNSNKIYASRWNVVYAKNAANNNWTTYTTPINQYISDLEIHPTDESTAFISYSGFTDNGKVYKSTNGGSSWQNISYNLPNLPILSLETYDTNPGAIFVGTYGGVYYLEENGTQWLKYGCIPNTAVNDIEIQYLNGDKIFIGTHGRGIFEAPLSPIQCSTSVAITPYVNDGTDWLQQSNLEACEGDNVSIGMQDIGTENVELIHPNGSVFIPDAATSWQINNIQLTSSGTYTIRYNDVTDGCSASTKEINIKVLPSTIDLSNPIQAVIDDENTLVNEGDTLTAKEGLSLKLELSSNLNSGTIVWTGPDGTNYATDTVSFSEVTENDPRVKGTWLAQITLTSNKCLDEKFTTQPQEVSFNMGTISNTDPSDENSYTISPNPFDSSFKLSGNFGDYNNSFTLFDVRRRLVKKWNIKTIENSREIEIDLSNINNGMYFFVIENKNIKLTKKIIKM